MEAYREVINFPRKFKYGAILGNTQNSNVNTGVSSKKFYK